MKYLLGLVLALLLLIPTARADGIDYFTWQTPFAVITLQANSVLSSYPYAAFVNYGTLSSGDMCGGAQFAFGMEPIGFDVNAMGVQPPGVVLEEVCYQPDPSAPPPGLDTFNYFASTITDAAMFTSHGDSFAFVPGTYGNGILTIVPVTTPEPSTGLLLLLGACLLCSAFVALRRRTA